MRVLLFAWLREALSGPSLTVCVPAGSPVSAVLCAVDAALASAGSAKSTRTCLVARGEDFIDIASETLAGDCELALIPPVSGG